MCREINNYDLFIKEEFLKVVGDWFRIVYGDFIFVVKNIYSLFSIFIKY